MKKLSTKLKALRQKLSGRADCPKGCFRCCTSMQFSEEEGRRLKQVCPDPPSGKGKGFCEYLDENGRCSVYTERPIVCRAMGKCDEFFLRCEHLRSENYMPEPPEFNNYRRTAVLKNRNGTDVSKYLEKPENARQWIKDVIKKEEEGEITHEEAEKYLEYLKKRC